MLKIAENSNSIFNLAVYVTKTQGMSDLIATWGWCSKKCSKMRREQLKNGTMVPLFGAKSSWFGWEKLVFSLGFHLRLWPGSFWGIQHLPELKIAEIFLFSWFPSVMRWSRSPYYWKSLRNLVFHSQSGNCGRILMIFTALESCGKSRLRMSQLWSSGYHF